MRSLTLSLTLLMSTLASAGEPTLAETYRDAAGRLIGAALVSDHAYDRLGYLCDAHAPRLSGSAALEAAIDWCADEMRADGFANVREEPVMVPRWVRGDEHARLLQPVARRLNMLGLGDSVGTPPGGIEAEVVVVSSFDELDALGEAGVKGKIVLYDVPFVTYGQTVQFRGSGPSRAAAYGAVAALVRSVGPGSYDTPHTGALRYDEEQPQIPAAAITIEDSAMMRRMQERGDTIRMQLMMSAKMHEPVPSANLVAEVVGHEKPDEIVVLAGHIDTWDVGQGAQDDGAGCVIAWEAARLIQELDLKPRRTIRVVLYTNEENGLAGGKTYVEEHADELTRHVAAIESDSGNGLASGFRFQVPPVSAEEEPDRRKAAREACDRPIAAEVKAILDEVAPLLAPLDADVMRCAGSGADVGPIVEPGNTVALGLDHDTTEYFMIHHTHADTFEKIIKDDLNRNIATMAVMAYVLADMPGRLLP